LVCPHPQNGCTLGQVLTNHRWYWKNPVRCEPDIARPHYLYIISLLRYMYIRHIACFVVFWFVYIIKYTMVKNIIIYLIGHFVFLTTKCPLVIFSLSFCILIHRICRPLFLLTTFLWASHWNTSLNPTNLYPTPLKSYIKIIYFIK
jgi:hypothetical protein